MKSAESNTESPTRHGIPGLAPGPHPSRAGTFWTGLTQPSALSLWLALLVAGTILLLRILGVDLGIGADKK